MKYFLLISLILMVQSCSSYCNNYGYIDFGAGGKVSIRGYSDESSGKGMKNVKKFPSSYSIDLNEYQLITETLLERDYPTVSVEALNKSNQKLGLVAEGGDSCLRVSQREGTVELWWRTAQSCKSHYPIEFSIMDSKGKKLRTFKHDISLVKNGQKCGIDGI